MISWLLRDDANQSTPSLNDTLQARDILFRTSFICTMNVRCLSWWYRNYKAGRAQRKIIRPKGLTIKNLQSGAKLFIECKFESSSFIVLLWIKVIEKSDYGMSSLSAGLRVSRWILMPLSHIVGPSEYFILWMSFSEC